MGSSLVWRPIVTVEGKSLPDDLKQALSKRFDLCIPTKFGDPEVQYIQGMLDAGVEGAKELLELINKYEAVELRLEW